MKQTITYANYAEAGRLKASAWISLYYLPNEVSLLYHQTINMEETNPEKIIPVELPKANKNDVIGSDAMDTLRKGMDMAIDRGASIDVVRNLRNEIIKEEKRLKEFHQKLEYNI